MTDNKHWAQEYVSGPLHEPTPGEETGPGSSFRPHRGDSTSKPTGSTTVAAHNTGSSTSTNPFRRSKPSASHDDPFATSPSPRTNKASASSHARRVSADSAHGPNPSSSLPLRNGKNPSTTITSTSPTSTRRSIDSSGPRRSADGPPQTSNNTTRPRRTSSLQARYPNDPSIHPLKTLTREDRHARRAKHLTKSHHQGSDSIDKLDSAALAFSPVGASGGGGYHHSGPYDAASLARNNSYTNAPVAALTATNREALRATPRESLQDSLSRHRPLDNVSSVPPGERDAMGRVYKYREGEEEDMMRYCGRPEGGAYKRYEGLTYAAEDLKGKGEPSYSIERGLKGHRHEGSGQGRGTVDGVDGNGDGEGVELVERERWGGGGGVDGRASTISGGSRGQDGSKNSTGSSDHQQRAASTSGREKSGSGSGLDGLKRRIGSLRRRDR